MIPSLTCRLLGLALCLLGSTSPAFAQLQRQSGGSGLISQEQAQRVGLTRAWAAQAGMDRTRDRLMSLTLAGNTLLTQTQQGVFQAIDAETGARDWSLSVGKRRYPSFAPAANGRFVAMINGNTLYLLDQRTARIVNEFPLEFAPASAPVMDDRRVYCMLSNGFMVSHELEAAKTPADKADPAAKEEIVATVNADAFKPTEVGEEYIPSEAFPLRSQSEGFPVSAPIAIPGKVAWTTDAGKMYIFDTVNEGLLFEFRTQAECLASPDCAEGVFFVTSRDRSAYAVDSTTGIAIWRYNSDDPINEPPVVLDGVVYVFPREDGIHALDAKKGNLLWKTAGPARFLSASPTRLYLTDVPGNLMVLDRQTGARLGTLPTSRLKIQALNRINDRIYLGTDTGMIQCLHEIGLDQPAVHQRILAAPPEESPALDSSDTPPADDPGTDDAGTDDFDADMPADDSGDDF
jgi:outer membrane protein assembly factor BamB